MKKSIIAISLIVSFLVVVIHEMIPHHHHEMDDTELFSHHHHSDNQETHSEADHNNHFPFPVHHHVSASENFDLVRVNNNLERQIVTPFCFLIPDHLFHIDKVKPPESEYYSDISVPLNSLLPFIISPNAMRGSPVVA